MSTSDRNGVTSEARYVAKTAAGVFGGSASVHRFYDEDEANSIGILTCKGTPQEGFSTYSTVGVHATPNMLDGKDVRVELAGVAASTETEYPNLLATAAFQVQKDGWLAAPGVVFPDLMRSYGLSASMEHLLWVEPFTWEDLAAVEVSSTLTVHWLLGVPIAESERRLITDEGYGALTALLEQHDSPYYDLHRQPVV